MIFVFNRCIVYIFEYTVPLPLRINYYLQYLENQLFTYSLNRLFKRELRHMIIQNRKRGQTKYGVVIDKPQNRVPNEIISRLT